MLPSYGDLQVHISPIRTTLQDNPTSPLHSSVSVTSNPAFHTGLMLLSEGLNLAGVYLEVLKISSLHSSEGHPEHVMRRGGHGITTELCDHLCDPPTLLSLLRNLQCPLSCCVHRALIGGMKVGRKQTRLM